MSDDLRAKIAEKVAEWLEKSFPHMGRGPVFTLADVARIIEQYSASVPAATMNEPTRSERCAYCGLPRENHGIRSTNHVFVPLDPGKTAAPPSPSLGEKLDAIMCEGCRLGLPRIQMSIDQNAGMNHRVNDDTLDDCTSKSAELLPLIAAEIQAARLDEARWWHRNWHRDTGIPCDGTMEVCKRANAE